MSPLPSLEIVLHISSELTRTLTSTRAHSDLHRFLADALEYRNRLSEIRDGILGVERRRKGMWKVVRTVANDFLAEEEGAVYGQQQQQQDGGASYD